MARHLPSTLWPYTASVVAPPASVQRAPKSYQLPPSPTYLSLSRLPSCHFDAPGREVYTREGLWSTLVYVMHSDESADILGGRIQVSPPRPPLWSDPGRMTLLRGVVTVAALAGVRSAPHYRQWREPRYRK